MKKPAAVSFTILGNLQSKSNSRKLVPTKNGMRSIKSPAAQKFQQQALLQIPAAARVGYEQDVVLAATIYYQSRRNDVDDTLLCDILEHAGVVKNDRQIRLKLIDGRETDSENPRVEVMVGPVTNAPITITGFYEEFDK